MRHRYLVIIDTDEDTSIPHDGTDAAACVLVAEALSDTPIDELNGGATTYTVVGHTTVDDDHPPLHQEFWDPFKPLRKMDRTRCGDCGGAALGTNWAYATLKDGTVGIICGDCRDAKTILASTATLAHDLADMINDLN